MCIRDRLVFVASASIYRYCLFDFFFILIFLYSNFAIFTVWCFPCYLMAFDCQELKGLLTSLLPVADCRPQMLWGSRAKSNGPRLSCCAGNLPLGPVSGKSRIHMVLGPKASHADAQLLFFFVKHCNISATERLTSYSTLIGTMHLSCTVFEL